MILERSMGIVRKILAIAALAVLAPGCPPGIFPPEVIASAPAFGAGGIPHWPFIVLQWDQAMDPATMTATNIAIFDNIGPSVFGPAPTVTYLPGSNQTLIVTQISLNSPTAIPNSGQYIVGVTSAVKALDGTPVAGPLYAAAFFTVTATGNVNPPLFSPPVPSDGASPGQIKLTFDLAMVSAVAMSGNYDVYQSTTSGGENLLATPAKTVTSTLAASDAAAASLPVGKGLITISPLTSATTYYFIVVARDTNGNVAPTTEISWVAP